MAIIVTIADRFDERARRHVKGVKRLMISSQAFVCIAALRHGELHDGLTSAKLLTLCR